MAITPRAVGAWAYAASGGVTTTLPTHAAGDMLLVRVAFKSSAVSTCVASTATGGWTKLGQFTGATNSGNGTGSVNLAVFYKAATSSSETNPAITFATATTQVGHVAIAYQKGAGETWDAPLGSGKDWTIGTTSVVAIISPAFGGATIDPGDFCDFWLASADDSAFTVPRAERTFGEPLGTPVEYPATAGLDGSGADGSYDGGYCLVTAAAFSEVRVLATLAAAETGTAWATRLRVTAAAATTPPYTSPYPPLLAQ